jgi:hypothetical protein
VPDERPFFSARASRDVAELTRAALSWTQAEGSDHGRDEGGRPDRRGERSSQGHGGDGQPGDVVRDHLRGGGGHGPGLGLPPHRPSLRQRLEELTACFLPSITFLSWAVLLKLGLPFEESVFPFAVAEGLAMFVQSVWRRKEKARS